MNAAAEERLLFEDLQLVLDYFVGTLRWCDQHLLKPPLEAWVRTRLRMVRENRGEKCHKVLRVHSTVFRQKVIAEAYDAAFELDDLDSNDRGGMGSSCRSATIFMADYCITESLRDAIYKYRKDLENNGYMLV